MGINNPVKSTTCSLLNPVKIHPTTLPIILGIIVRFEVSRCEGDLGAGKNRRLARASGSLNQIAVNFKSGYFPLQRSIFAVIE